MDIKQLLNEWQLADLVDVFESQCITTELLPELDNDLLRELIPNIGSRIRFTEKLKLYLGNDTGVEDKDGNSSGISQNTRWQHQVPEGAIFFPLQDDTSSNASTGSTASEIVVPLVSRDTSFHSLDHFFKCRAVFPDFDLKTLLQTTPFGNSVLNYYKANQMLDNTRRNYLVDIIMKRLFNYHVTHRLNHADYNTITSKIVTLFPNEAAQVYYIPSIKKKDSFLQQSVVAKGKLVDKARNLIYNSDIRKVRQRKRTGGQEIQEKEQPLEKQVKIDDFNNSLVFLKTWTEPWDEVIKHWKQTFPLRRRKENQCKTISDILNHWPCLNDPRAESLINADFDQLFPENRVKLFNKWFKFFEVVSIVRRENCKNLDLLEQLSGDNDIDENCKVAIQLRALPHIIPSRGRKTLRSKKIWKYSVQEAVDSVIVHAKTVGDIERLVELQKEKALSKDITTQPYILIEGPTEHEIRSIYIIIDKVKYQCDSVLKAIDLCFKIFYVFNAEYPPQGQHIWYLIQTCIYNIDSGVLSKYPYLMDIVQYCKNVNFDN